MHRRRWARRGGERVNEIASGKLGASIRGLHPNLGDVGGFRKIPKQAKKPSTTSMRHKKSDMPKQNIFASTETTRHVLDFFHHLRLDGNAATHQHKGDHAKALACLKMVRQLGIWFYRSITITISKQTPFHPPRPPIDASAELTAELGRLGAERDAAPSAAERAKAAAADAEAARVAAEMGARGTADERALWEQLPRKPKQVKTSLPLNW